MTVEDDPRTIASRRRSSLRMQQPLPITTRIDRMLFVLGAIVAIWLAVLIAVQGFQQWWSVLLLIPVWGIIAYLALPRLHRMLSDLYVPDYFFGRTRTGDGLLGDPVNMAVDGSLAQLDAVMLAGGWYRADEINLRSTWGIIASTLFRRSYPTAPVSPLFLFGRRHDVAYQQEVEGNPKQRHHVRFWHTPPEWLLPGGARVDWLGAGTYDTDVGLSLFTLQVTHRIDENTDVERDYVVDSMRTTSDDVRVNWLRDFTTGYHSRNGGGDRFITDGHLPIVDVNAVVAETRADASSAADASAVADDTGPTHMIADVSTLPLTVVFGVIGVILGAVLELLSLFTGSVNVELTALDETELGIIAVVAITVIAFLAVVLIVQLVLTIRVLRGRAPRSRLLLVALLVIGIIAMAASYWSGEIRLALDTTLLAATVHSGAVLALTSESAATWARWGRRRPSMDE